MENDKRTLEEQLYDFDFSLIMLKKAIRRAKENENFEDIDDALKAFHSKWDNIVAQLSGDERTDYETCLLNADEYAEKAKQPSEENEKKTGNYYIPPMDFIRIEWDKKTKKLPPIITIVTTLALFLIEGFFAFTNHTMPIYRTLPGGECVEYIGIGWNIQKLYALSNGAENAKISVKFNPNIILVFIGVWILVSTVLNTIYNVKYRKRRH